MVETRPPPPDSKAGGCAQRLAAPSSNNIVPLRSSSRQQSESRSMFSEAVNAGQGFGLGFAVTIDPVKAMLPTSAGEFYWGGIFSTAFFVDPVERIHMILMTQLTPSSSYPLRRQLRTMIYAALR